MRLFKSALLLFVLVLSGCAQKIHVVTESTAFFNEKFSLSGAIYVKASNDKVAKTLEFVRYKKKLEEKLKTVGYTIAEKETDADYIAILSYGIGGGGKIVYSKKYSQYSTVSTKTSKTHVRLLGLEILKDGETIYESKARSKGFCGILAGVFNEILEGMFIDFPGDSGKIRRNSVIMKGSC